MLLPSLEAHCMQAAEDRNTHTRVIALELLIDSRCHEDDFDEDDLRKQYGDWDWWCLLPLIAESVIDHIGCTDEMYNQWESFSIDRDISYDEFSGKLNDCLLQIYNQTKEDDNE